MLAPTPFAGVDVGKRFLDLGFEPAARPLRVANDAAGIALLIEALRRRGASRVAIEAIGPYAWPLTATLVSIASPHPQVQREPPPCDRMAAAGLRAARAGPTQSIGRA